MSLYYPLVVNGPVPSCKVTCFRRTGFWVSILPLTVQSLWPSYGIPTSFQSCPLLDRVDETSLCGPSYCVQNLPVRFLRPEIVFPLSISSLPIFGAHCERHVRKSCFWTECKRYIRVSRNSRKIPESNFLVLSNIVTFLLLITWWCPTDHRTIKVLSSPLSLMVVIF